MRSTIKCDSFGSIKWRGRLRRRWSAERVVTQKAVGNRLLRIILHEPEWADGPSRACENFKDTYLQMLGKDRSERDRRKPTDEAANSFLDETASGNISPLERRLKGGWGLLGWGGGGQGTPVPGRTSSFPDSHVLGSLSLQLSNFEARANPPHSFFLHEQRSGKPVYLGRLLAEVLSKEN